MYGLDTEDKFKVGDRVRVVKLGDGGSHHGADIGDTDTIIADADDYGRFEGEQWFYNPDEIELVAAEPAPKFKVGQRVRVVKDGSGKDGSCHGAAIGSIGNVTEFDGEYYGRDDDWYFKEHEIELVAAEVPAPAPKYKVGQRVRVVDADGGGKVGDIATVTDATFIKGEDSHIYTLDGLSDGAAMLWGRRLAPAFLAGDKVRVTKHSGYFAAGDIGEVESQSADVVYLKHGSYQRLGLPIDADSLELLEAAQPEPWLAGEWESDETLAGFLDRELKRQGFVHARGAEDPCIVARVVGGTPRPSNIPYVHPDVGSATTEAERLARNNPGQEFAVYQRVAGRVAEVSYSMKEVA